MPADQKNVLSRDGQETSVVLIDDSVNLSSEVDAIALFADIRSV